MGSFFGAMLARAGTPVTLIGRKGSSSPHLGAVAQRGVTIDGVDVQERVKVAVSRTAGDVAGADLVLFAVKTPDTETAARSLAPHLGPRTIVVSLQNGIENVERMATAGVRALPAVVFVAAEIERPGTVRHRGRGDLILSSEDDRREVEAVARLFEEAGVPCPISEDFARAQWTKLIINAMANAISALAGVPYRALAEYEPTWNLAVTAAHEGVAVARRRGVDVDVAEVIETARAIAFSVGDATSSTEQDLARGRPTEIQALNGVLSRLGAELGVATPTHDALTALVGLREQ